MSIYRGSQCIAGVYTLLDKANTDLSNLTTTGRKAFLNKQQITNCILEDPQKIILSLNNGTLTLHAGSVVCVPNGFESDGTTPKFDEVTIASDKTLSYGHNTIDFVFYKNNGIEQLPSANLSSGTVAPSGLQYMLWYDTANNLVKFTDDGGSTWIGGISFPCSIVTTDTTQVTSINQTFQSIGYIGSTVFVRKGLKVLMPNGKNADGSLKNIERVTSKVFTRTFTGTTDFVLGVNNNDFGIDAVYYYTQETKPTEQYCAWYKPSENITRFTNNNAIVYGAIVCSAHRTDGKIDYFNPYTATNILKYSDKSQISGWGMPSSRYIDLTLGASGSTYTAPANGWFQCACTGTAGSTYFELVTEGASSTASFTGGWARASIPVSKNRVVTVYYGGTNFTKQVFRFTYAEGEQ